MKIKQIIIYLFITSSLFSEEFLSYEENLVHTFENLGLLSDSAYENKPSSISVDNNNNFIIADMVNKRILIFDKNYKLIDEYIDDAYVSSSTYLNNYNDTLLFGVNSSSRHFILNKANGKSVEVNIKYSISDPNTTATVFTEKVIFSYLRDGSLVSFVLEDVDELRYSNMLNREDTHNLFKESSKYGLMGYTLDDKDRIFYEGVLVNGLHSIMYQYWSENHTKYSLVNPSVVPGVPEFSKLKNVSSAFIGSDLNGNYYRSNDTGAIVFDPQGWVLAYIDFKHKGLTPATVNSDGDLFYLVKEYSNNKTVINLYKIERQW